VVVVDVVVVEVVEVVEVEVVVVVAPHTSAAVTTPKLFTVKQLVPSEYFPAVANRLPSLSV
jgi:hypothetical protein